MDFTTFFPLSFRDPGCLASLHWAPGRAVPPRLLALERGGALCCGNVEPGPWQEVGASGGGNDWGISNHFSWFWSQMGNLKQDRI